MLVIKKEKKLVLTQSMVVAIQLTQMMAEALVGSDLTLCQASIIVGNIEDEGSTKEYGRRKVKTDCEFIDKWWNGHIVIAWITMTRMKDEWRPTFSENFIKLDGDTPRQMEYADNSGQRLNRLFFSRRDERLSRLPQLDCSRIH